MTNSSSSSASDSSSIKKSKKKKKHKDKKSKSKTSKKDKSSKKKDTSKKDGKRQRKEIERKERAEAWECDRSDAVRLLKQLLELDADVAEDLVDVFEPLDNGETVHVDGLENKGVRKKLRHLLQALRLSPVDGQGFRSPDRKVSFLALFKACLHEAQGSMPVKEPSPEPKASPVAAKPEQPEQLVKEKVDAVKGEEVAPREPARPRIKGPQLPMPGVGAVVPDDDQGSSDEGEAGPRREGDERDGVNLDNLDESGPKHDEWMSTPHASLAGAFADIPGGRQAEKFEVKRSPEQQKAFEEMVKARGPSLLSKVREGHFAGHEDEMDRMRKRKHNAGQEIWGMSAGEQERHGQGLPVRRAFDPEEDLKAPRRPMAAVDFDKLVEQSGGALAGRFSRGNIATSFL